MQSLNSINDVKIENAKNAQVLSFDSGSSHWVNTAPSSVTILPPTAVASTGYTNGNPTSPVCVTGFNFGTYALLTIKFYWTAPANLTTSTIQITSPYTSGTNFSKNDLAAAEAIGTGSGVNIDSQVPPVPTGNTVPVIGVPVNGTNNQLRLYWRPSGPNSFINLIITQDLR